MAQIVNLYDIKDHINLKDVVEATGWPHRKSGATWFIKCPYHFDGTQEDRKIGNCYISKKGRIYICKACGRTGDVISFLKETMNLDFVKAVEWISDMSDIKIQYANEGDTYEDRNGQSKTVRKIISYEDQKFLEISNEPIYDIKKILYEDTGEGYAIQEENETVFWIEKESKEINPLSRIASQNYDLYKKIIRFFVMRKYEKIKRRILIWEKSESSLSVSVINSMIDDIFRLKIIYTEVNGDKEDLSIPSMKKKEFKFLINHEEEPF